ncbi:D-2-hydroxyacid dehydrogenase [Alteromonas sp. ASW11-130]|uniref:D-2-hydroxyacid dehydrogenase n=1 Tax=Alteromonas sp. ASW11-130 TaxID=3015775 RepID=UPI002242AA9D|nr:D-2-hydroxyacid dehydrogenase [Alteromonas sp. ASW11-130]MCW8093364.1 D-2-hydroxyacid dehydrogenase [Alteromonas sp. ASW11-130]
MSKPTAVILDFESLKPATLNLSSLNNVEAEFEIYQQTRPEDVVSRIQHAPIILTNKVKLPAHILEQAPLCRYVGILATGTNNVDVSWCHKNGMTVKNVENYGSAAVAQHTLMLLLNLATSFNRYNSDVRQGKWSASSQFCLHHHPVSQLEGKQAVLVGSGAIGNKVADLFKALGMRVTFAAREGIRDDTRPELDSLLPTADVISLHCPLTSSTQALVNSNRLNLMKPSAFLLNTARGELIDEGALLNALKQGKLAGAGLDVLSEEPPPADHPLITANLPNLLITPHCAWVADEARQRLFDLAMSHVADFLKAD